MTKDIIALKPIVKKFLASKEGKKFLRELKNVRDIMAKDRPLKPLVIREEDIAKIRENYRKRKEEENEN